MKQPVERRLAAILAADVAGYSRLMGLDEAGTAQALREHRAAADPLVSQHGGRIVKTTGDGVLIEFGSVVGAVQCAIGLQQLAAERNAGIASGRRMEWRIGIHLGDVLVEGEDILGDGVNIAARLEGIAEPGGICISEDAFRQVRGKIEAEFADIGEQSLKNIARPVRAYAMSAEAVASTDRDRGLVGVAERKCADGTGAGTWGSEPANFSSNYQHASAPLVVRCPALCQPVERSRPGVFRRRDHRRSNH